MLSVEFHLCILNTVLVSNGLFLYIEQSKHSVTYIKRYLQLREPQVEAYAKLYEYFKSGRKTAIIQIPGGCGKSGIAAIAPFGIAKGRALVVAPNLTIKEGLFESLDVTNRQKCFWRKRDILAEKAMIGGPFATTLDTGNISVCEKSHFVVSNVHQLATNPEKWLHRFPKDFFRSAYYIATRRDATQGRCHYCVKNFRGPPRTSS